MPHQRQELRQFNFIVTVGINLFDEFFDLWRIMAKVGFKTHVLHEAANFKLTQGATVLLIMGVEHVVDPEQLVPVLSEKLIVDVCQLRNCPFSRCSFPGRAFFQLQQANVDHLQIHAGLWPDLLRASFDCRGQRAFRFIQAHLRDHVLKLVVADAAGISGCLHFLHKETKVRLRPLLKEFPACTWHDLGAEGFQRNTRGPRGGLFQGLRQVLR
mmetsp:Transcript_47034/g.102396  ORF Transcript_47034/g.102396 Transcript_47034/m.102396 type:complete len:213 (+) Transcript_47034:1029-1667(+)